MNIFKFILILAGMHLIGSAILFGFVWGPAFIIAPIAAFYGIPMLLPEAIYLGLIRHFYTIPIFHKLRGLVIQWVMWTISGGVIAALFTPKEESNELKFWIAGFLGGIGATIFALACIHFRNRLEQSAGENASRPTA